MIRSFLMKRHCMTLCMKFIAHSILPLCIIQCISPSKVDTADPSDNHIIGTVYVTEGARLKPASDARVSFVAARTHPDSVVVLSVLSNNDGIYKLDKSLFIANTSYNLFAEKDGKKAYKNNALTSTSTTANDTVAPVTLDITGSISGYILLQSPHSNTQAILFIQGSNRFVRPDSSGYFLIDSLAPGNYPVHIIAEPAGYKSFDTVLTIHSGICDTLSQPIKLSTNLVPVVDNFTIDYDPVLMLAYLSWSHPTTDVKGYRIYRSINDSVYELLNEDSLPLTDSFYVDNVYKFKDSTASYVITAIDYNDNESDRSTVLLINVVSALTVKDSVFVSGDIGISRELHYDDTENKIYGCGLNFAFCCNTNGTGFQVYHGTPDSSGFLPEYRDLATDSNHNLYLFEGKNVLKLNANFIQQWSLPVLDSGEYNGEIATLPDGTFYFCTWIGANQTVIKKYGTDTNLISTSTRSEIIYDIRRFLSNIYYCYSDLYITYSYIDICDYDLNVTETRDLANYLKLLPPHIKPRCNQVSLISSYNNYKIIMYEFSILIISPNDKIVARQYYNWKDDIMVMDPSNNFYSFKNGTLYTYRSD